MRYTCDGILGKVSHGRSPAAGRAAILLGKSEATSDWPTDLAQTNGELPFCTQEDPWIRGIFVIGTSPRKLEMNEELNNLVFGKVLGGVAFLVLAK
jgi:hypothetical protein